jgi:NADPH:quinone reductase-like Zn-dependent oxidoreductase
MQYGAGRSQFMKAVIHRMYGSPEKVLSLEEVEKPVPKDGEVLVRVRAASMHPDVWHVIQGYPAVLRLMGNGVRRPRLRIPGTDLSGVIESVGKNVTRFKVADEVFGESAKFGWLNGGAYAEFAAVPQDFLVVKPKNVTFEQAAAVPTAGMIALNNLGGAERPRRQSVLINGAGGCMGSIAVQIAKADGARVTGVDCAEKLPMLQSLGADHVIDYKKEDYLQSGERYDLIIDVVSIRSYHEYKQALSTSGSYIPIGHAHYDNSRRRILGDIPYFMSLLFRAFLDREKRKNFKMLKKPEALAIFRSLLESGKLAPVVGRTFPLREVPAAMRCMQEGQALGRVIITPWGSLS